MKRIDVRTGRAMTPLLEKVLRDLQSASEYINDTGDVESEELDQIATSIKHAQTKLEYYLGSL